jgi:hypothetical protein
MARKSTISPEQWAEWEAQRRALAARLAERVRLGAEIEARAERRRERLRRLSLGLLGR